MFVFVILHYESNEDTKECINSLLSNLKQESFQVVVVDNNSPNLSGQKLQEIYKNNSFVKIILNESNKGFSAGNNIGCRYAIKEYEPDFICVMNNDTFIDDPFFIQKIYVKNQVEKFDALGPKIWNIKRRYNQNPFKVLSSLEEVNEAFEFNKKAQKFLYSIFPFAYYVFCKYFSKNNSNQTDGLHGAAIVFSKKYYLKFSDIFPEITFMYGEESLLNYRRIKDNLKFVFDFDITVYHNHSASTKYSSKGIVGKWRFQNKLILDSLNSLQNIYINQTNI